MELKQIKELMAAMGRTGTKLLVIKKEGFELQLERSENEAFKMNDSFLEGGNREFSKSDYALQKASIALSRGREVPVSSSTQLSELSEELPGSYVNSPMVGTFYSASSPDDPSFVKVGDKIEKNTVVCIIEAMKVMNEVKAGIAGTVAEILVENGQPIEFGTKLFRII